MAITNVDSVSRIVCDVLYNNVKKELTRRFVEMITKDIEPILEEYTKQIVVNVSEMRDPSSLYDMKLNIMFKLPNPPEVKNG